jgi:ribosomal protein L24
VTVAGVNIVKRHLKDTAARPQARQTTKGGIVSSEAPIHASNVQLVVKDDRARSPHRVGYQRAEVTASAGRFGVPVTRSADRATEGLMSAPTTERAAGAGEAAVPRLTALPRDQIAGARVGSRSRT